MVAEFDVTAVAVTAVITGAATEVVAKTKFVEVVDWPVPLVEVTV